MLTLLLFFPSVTFGLLAAEIFPWAILYSVFHLRRVDWSTWVLIAAMSLSALWVFISSSSSSVVGQTDILRSLAAYLNIVLVFQTVLSQPHARIEGLVRVARYVFFGLLVLGVLQLFSLLEPIAGLLSFLVPRASGGALTEQGNRGVTLLASEPARAGMELVYLYLIFRMTEGYKRQGLFLWDLVFLAYVALVIKSASAAAFGVLVFFLATGQRPRNIVLWLMAGTAAFFVPDIFSNGRVGILLSSLKTFSSYEDMMFFVANESGHRLLAFYAFIEVGLKNLLGFGIGNWQDASIHALQTSGIDYRYFRYFEVWGGGGVLSVRAPGVIPNLMLDMGLVGVSLLLFWMWRLTHAVQSNRRIYYVVMAILLVKITLFGSVGEPLPWIATALLLRWRYDTGPQIAPMPEVVRTGQRPVVPLHRGPGGSWA